MIIGAWEQAGKSGRAGRARRELRAGFAVQTTE